MAGASWRGKRGTYREVKLIAKSGMGIAYDAAGPGGMRVVVKVPATEIDGQPMEPSYHAMVVEKLKVEAQVLKNFARDSPPNIVRYVDEAAGGGGFFLAIERIEGRTLDKSVPPAGYPEDRVVAMSLDVLRGLEFVHRHNTIYRDIKPANVMVRPDGRCVMIDFGGVKQGTVRAMSFTSGDHTKIRSPGWTCPHQDAGRMSAECDLYAFGRVMFYMGTGIKPDRFADAQGRVTRTMRDVKPGVSGELSGLVDRMLDPDHGSVRTAAEVMRELRSMGRQPAAAPVQRVARVAQATPPRPGAGPAFSLSAGPPLRRRAARAARRAARGVAMQLWMGLTQPAPQPRRRARRGARRRAAGPGAAPGGAAAAAAAARGAGMLARGAGRAIVAARRRRAAGPGAAQAAAAAAAQRGARQRARAAMALAARGSGRRGSWGRGGARIILQGVTYHVSEGPGGTVIGRRHDMDACRAAGGGCNVRGRGRNVFVGWPCPAGCRCEYNPGHVIGRHHMKLWRDRRGRMMVRNNDPHRRSAISRGRGWAPMRHGRAEVLRDRDQVALLYNEAKGPYMEFTFYGR